MGNPLLLIKDAVIGLIKQMDPMLDIYAEEIKKTQFEEDNENSESYYFVDIIPTSNQTIDKDYSDFGVLVDIAYHDKNELNVTYLQKQAEIDYKIRPVFQFGDRKITIHHVNTKISDHILHYTFPLNFRICRDETEELERMGELETTIKEGMRRNEHRLTRD